MNREIIKEFDCLAAQYHELISSQFSAEDFREYNEILFSAHNCGIEGNSFSVDETRTLKERGLGMIPTNKPLVEAFEMLDHFAAYEHMVQALQNQRWHPMEVAAIFHGNFEWLHPFRDGNGRLGRLLVNKILLRHNLPILIIPQEKREEYIECMKLFRTDALPLIGFFFRTAMERMSNEIEAKKNATENFRKGWMGMSLS